MRRLFHWSMLSFVLVAILGSLMRYKIGYSLPWLEQKLVQHGHSHFAFGGWVSQTLWLFILSTIYGEISSEKQKQTKGFLWVHLGLSYGMLIGFLAQGYGPIAIVFSSIYLLWNAFLVVHFWRLLSKFGQRTINDWFRWSMLFQLLSAIGTLMLIFTMVQKNAAAVQHLYLASVYWYLHFTYNGWFFFACMGLFSYSLKSVWNLSAVPRKVFVAFVVSCIPAYGLSILWLQLPILGYILVVLAALAQVLGFYWLVENGVKIRVIERVGSKSLSAWFLRFLSIALAIKFSLQLGSVIPTLSQLAFGFRPIVIAYLHLILLSIISVFLLAFAYWNGWFGTSKSIKMGLIVTLSLILVNQLFLAFQGATSLSYTLVPGINLALLVIAIGLTLVLTFLLVKIPKG